MKYARFRIIKTITPVNGGVGLFSDETGALAALVDFHLVTNVENRGGRLCGLKLTTQGLNILIVGAGTVGHSCAAYGAGFLMQNSDQDTQQRQGIATKYPMTRAVQDLRLLLRWQYRHLCLMSTTPVLRDWFQPGSTLI